MAKNDQKNIIQEQMQANKRIIKAASTMTGRYTSRTSLNERMRRFVERDTPNAPPRPMKSK